MHGCGNVNAVKMFVGRIMWERSMTETPSDTPPGATSRTIDKIKSC